MINANVPLWSPRFRTNETTFDLEYKPFPRYPTWLVAWEMSWLVDVFSSYDALFAGIADQFTAVNAAMIVLAADIATAQATADAALASAGSGETANRRVSMFHDESVCTFGTPAINVDATQRYGFYRYAVLQGNVFETSFVMDLTDGATIYFLGFTSSNSGQMDVYVDGVGIATIDFYTLATVRNVEKTAIVNTGIFGAGRHHLEMRAPTKHGSSSGYAIVLTKIHVISALGD